MAISKSSTKARKAAVTFFSCSPLSLPARCTCHHDSRLLTFRRSSSPSVQPRFKGHAVASVHADEPESAPADEFLLRRVAPFSRASPSVRRPTVSCDAVLSWKVISRKYW